MCYFRKDVQNNPMGMQKTPQGEQNLLGKVGAKPISVRFSNIPEI